MKRKTSGFTLIELLIVIAIIGMLASIVVVNLVRARDRADDAASKAYLREVTQGVEMKRYGSSFTLPPAQACTSLIDKPGSPNSVTNCVYRPLRRDAYNVTVTSKTGVVFIYDGHEIDQRD